MALSMPGITSNIFGLLFYKRLCDVWDDLAHLRHRSHGREFWAYVTTLSPGWETTKAWLDKHQLGLSAEFLTASKGMMACG